MALPHVSMAPTDALAQAGWAAQLRWQLLRQWRRLQARLRSTWRPLSVALLAPPHAPGDAASTEAAIDAALDALDAWAAEHEGVNVAVQLSSRWLLCCATPDAADAVQAREAAQQQWAHYFGLTPEALASEWQLNVVVHAGAATTLDVRLVCAVPRALIDGLKAVACERGLALQAAMPWWAEGLQDACGCDLAEHPATAQPGGSQRSWSWAEPGVLTQAQAEVREGRWVLARLWSEPGTDTNTDAHATKPSDGTDWVWPLDASPAQGVTP